MTQLTLTITRAGMERFTAAQLGEDIDLTIASVGLTDAEFIAAPTLTALPGEFRRLAAVSGEQVGDSIVHITMRDTDAVGYAARGLGLFLADGTLFATYGQIEQLFEKSPRAAFLAAIDLVFPTGDVTQLTFGATDFLNPPATTETKGVVELATQAEGLAGTDAQRVPPVAVVAAMIDAIPAASTTVAGLVELATTEEGQAGTDAQRVPPVAIVAEMVADAVTAQVPPGVILLWAGQADAVPRGWALCDGRTVDRADGTGQIVTPDLRGRVPVGVSAAHPLGLTFGAETATTTAAPDHVHAADATVDVSATGTTIATTMRSVDAGGSANNVLTTVTLNDPTHAHTAAVTTQAAGGHAHDVSVVQPSIALHYILKV